MDIIGNEGLNSCALIKGSVGNSDEFRDMLKSAPFDLSAGDFATDLKIGKVVTVYEACLVTADLVNKADAEWILQNRPPEVPREELETALKVVESRRFALTSGMKPFKGFYERMLLQVETSWKVVSCTEFTNSLMMSTTQSRG